MTETQNEPVRGFCHGISPLAGRLETWQLDLLADQGALADLIGTHGSPINLTNPDHLAGRADELIASAGAYGVDGRIFFARKANKSLGLVDAALAAGHGIDVASEGELLQVLDRGADPSSVILTAAVKPRSLLARAVGAGVTISVDNLDEIDLLTDVAEEAGHRARVALRCAPEEGLPTSRFGMTATEIIGLLEDRPLWSVLNLEGFHFHLAGYDHAQRAVMLDRVLDLVDHATGIGHDMRYVDIGGGVPMRYLDSEQPWLDFWRRHRRALRGEESSMLWSDDPLGLTWRDGEIHGDPRVYPMWQEPVRGPWLEALLTTSGRSGATMAERLRSAGIALHLEPGRSLLDGCGLTVARVESRKQAADGTWYIGLAMNRTQCRSAAADFLLDPIVVPNPVGRRTDPIEGYLVGAYCIEAELLTLRRMVFPQGVAVGDLVAFVNTAGYMMHILESASHQIPLARNLTLSGEKWVLDDIDR